MPPGNVLTSFGVWKVSARSNTVVGALTTSLSFFLFLLFAVLVRKAPVRHHFGGLSQVAWSHKIYPLTRDISSSGGTSLGQASLAGRCSKPCSIQFKKPQQVGCMTRSCARRETRVANVVATFSGVRMEIAVGPGLRLVHGALCNDCDSAKEDVEAIASGKAGVTATVTV
eukprot:365111-Chlamydomonas_euryale.AAC.2